MRKRALSLSSSTGTSPPPRPISSPPRSFVKQTPPAQVEQVRRSSMQLAPTVGAMWVPLNVTPLTKPVLRTINQVNGLVYLKTGLQVYYIILLIMS